MMKITKQEIFIITALIICYKKLYYLCLFLKILINLQKNEKFNKKGFHFDCVGVIILQVVFMFMYVIDVNYKIMEVCFLWQKLETDTTIRLLPPLLP